MAARTRATWRPVLALAAADRFARTGAATAGEVDISDLDAATRADWTAEQWQRAEAAGMLAIAAATEPQHSQRSDADAAGEEAEQEELRVWWDDIENCWKTDFPPPDDLYIGKEDGEYGEDGYERELTEEEAELVEAPHIAMVERMREVEGALRDAHFAKLERENGALCDNPEVMLALAPPVEERH